MVLTAVVFLAYLAVLVIMGIRQSKGVDSMESYWMADRSLPAYRIAFCLAASWFGLSSFTGQAGWVYREGLGAFWYLGIPNSAAILIIGLIFVRRIRKLPAISQPELLEVRYSGAIRPWLGIIILLAFSGYSAMEYIALKYVFEQFMGWPGLLGNIVVLAATMLYVQFGGMNTVVWTQVVQYLALLVSGIIVGVAGINAASHVLPAGTSVFAVPHLDGGNWWSLFSIGTGTVFAMIVAYWPGWSTEQDPWQRVWMARDTKAAVQGTIAGAVLNFIAYTFTLLMAVAAWTLIGAPQEGQNVEEIVYILMKQTLPVWLIAISLVGFAAAAMSNISVFSASAASNIVKDWYQRLLRPHASQKELVFVSRVIVTLCLALGLFVAQVMPTILDVLFLSATIATTGYFVPIIGALFWRRGNTAGAIASLVIGGGSDILFYALQRGAGVEFPVEPVIPALCLSVAAYIIVSLATKAPPIEKLLPFFETEARKFIERWRAAGVSDAPETADETYVRQNLYRKAAGERIAMRLGYTLEGVDFTSAAAWRKFVDILLENKSWVWLSGYDVVYKVYSPDMLANARLARGDAANDVLLYCEPLAKDEATVIRYLAVALNDLRAAATALRRSEGSR